MGSLKRHAPWVICLLISISAGTSGSYIWAKAMAAQVLLRHAWIQTDSGSSYKPWPWADTYPVGRLLSRVHGVDLVILSGVSGRSLAFGPGHQPGSAKPGSDGHVVLAAHRDTHFSFVQTLSLGDQLWLESRDRQMIPYVVDGLKVVDEHDVQYLDQRKRAALTLVTCYPFDSPIAGGPERYLVQLTRSGQRGFSIDQNTP